MEEKKKGFFGRLVEGLNKTRENIVSGMDSIFSGFSAINEDFYEELEETLIMGDLGIKTSMSDINHNTIFLLFYLPARHIYSARFGYYARTNQNND